MTTTPTFLVVSVIRHPSPTLVLPPSDAALGEYLPEDVRSAMASNGVVGNMEVIGTAGAGQGNPSVHVYLIMDTPLKADVTLFMPTQGFIIYMQSANSFTKLSQKTLATPIPFTLHQQGKDTMLYMDIPEDHVRMGRGVFRWDANGNPDNILTSESSSSE